MSWDLLALAAIIGVSSHEKFVDLKSRFCKMLSEYFYDTLKTLSVNCDNARQKFLRLWDWMWDFQSFCIIQT